MTSSSLQLTLIILTLLLSTTVIHTSPQLVSSPIHDSFAPTPIFESILSNLGFQDLSTAVPSLSDDAAFNNWNGPTTVFAPTDASIRSCSSCSVARLLREHIVPGLFSHDYLQKLAFGTKIETMVPGRCVTVTSANNNNNNNNYTKIFIGGVEITRPDLFNNGLVVVHGLQGYVAPLSTFSCNVERMTSLSFPAKTEGNNHRQSVAQQSLQSPGFIMRLMLRDAMLRLRNSGFGIVSLAMKLKAVDLMSLQNFTVFAVDDVAIFSGSHSYVNNVRFHIVPNKVLAIYDLEKLASGTVLPTLESGQSLMVTTSAAGVFTPMRINYVRIKVPDVMRNLKIVVHSIYLPFPHLHPSAVLYTDAKLIDDVNMTVASRDDCKDKESGRCGVKPMVARMKHQGL